MEKGQVVKVYDGDLIGFTTAVLKELNEVVERGVLERWTMETEDGTQLVRFVRNHSNAAKDGCGYILEEEEEEIKKSFYCKGSGESHYGVSEEYYINTFDNEEYIDICYNKTPEIEGVTIDRKDILRIAQIIKIEDRKRIERSTI